MGWRLGLLVGWSSMAWAQEVPVPETYALTPLSMSEEARSALRAQDWPAAYEALGALDPEADPGSARVHQAFVRSWAALRSDHGAQAVAWLPYLDGPHQLPADYVGVVKGELLAAAGRNKEALTVLQGLPSSSPVAARAMAVEVGVLRQLGRLSEASSRLDQLLERPDPAVGQAQVLAIRAKVAGVGSDAGLNALRRLWAWYPGTQEDADGRVWLGDEHPGWKPTAEERLIRARRMAQRGGWNDVLELTHELAGQFEAPSPSWCEAHFLRGRAYYKKNELTNAVNAFGKAGERCAGVEGGLGHKTMYLVGYAQFRRGHYTSSAAAYTALANLYPNTTYADDGLTRAGIAWLEAGHQDRARRSWHQGLERFPEGDTVPEASFRLAQSYYQEGQTDQALEILDALGKLDPSADEVHVAGARYWAARMRAFPQSNRPTEVTSDEGALLRALNDWQRLCTEWPHHTYAILAYNRLLELDGARAQAVATMPRPSTAPRPYKVSSAFASDPEVLRGLQLVATGLVVEGRARWAHLDALTPDEMAVLAHARIEAGDWLSAGRWMHDYLRKHPVGTLGPRQGQIVRLAYPDRYWNEVQEAAASYDYDPRLFHALVREESSFDRLVVSHAGAIGLSQLMPGTADTVARWMGVKVSRAQLRDPLMNLTLGSRYLSKVLAGMDGNPYLALAGYNAGPARVRQWVGEWNNPPLDAFIEAIPYRETRGYAKRVTGTWQTYHVYFGTGPLFPDLSRFNHHAQSASGD